MLPPVAVETVDGRRWTVREPYTWRTWTVPVGFVTDFASTPRAIWWWLPPAGPYVGAAVLHDWWYATDGMSRREADRLFLEAMREAGVPAPRRAVMYAAVRAAGWRAWRRYRRATPATPTPDRTPDPDPSD